MKAALFYAQPSLASSTINSAVAAAIAPVVPTIPTDKTQMVYMAHRGSVALYPEASMVGYRNSIADGQYYLEGDVQTLSDGTLVMMHDVNVDRTTDGSGNVNTFNAASWAALHIDTSSQVGSNYGNTLPVPTFQNIIDAFNGRAILVMEDKDHVSMSAMVRALINNGVRRDQVVVQSFGLANLPIAVAAGYPTVYLSGAGDTANIPGAVSAGIPWVGLDSATPDNETAQWLAAGLKVTFWTVNRRYIRDQKIAIGATGFFSDDPFYLSQNVPIYSSDKFSRQTWLPGMFGNLAADGITDLNSRGAFTAPDMWGYKFSTGGYYGCLQGYLCPILGKQTPFNYAINFHANFGTSNADMTRWCSAFIGTSDLQFQDGVDGSSGYHFLFRKNGLLQIYKKPVGVAASKIAETQGPAFTEGVEYSLRITVTAQTLRASLLDNSNTEIAFVTVNDTTYRGAYLHLGRDGTFVNFRAISVSAL